MSGLSGIVNWDNSEVDKTLLIKMTNLIRHRGPGGLYNEVSGNVGLGFAKLVLKESEKKEVQPLWLPDKSCAIVADVRLYNRKQLIEKIGSLINWYKGEPSDVALLLAAYVKWDTQMLDHLDGDFAFAIWDNNKNSLFAARDPFGVKPFFYYRSPHRFLFASEPKQILVHPDVSIEPDKMIVGEYLFNNFEDIGRTFFEEVKRLKPSHYILATKDNIKEIRYWNPNPENEIYYPKPEDYLERFKELFIDAVYKRLMTSYPVAAHLSGGVDSSSIVVAAGSLYKNSSNGLPNLETISAVFRDIPCDETVYIDAVSNRVPFKNYKFSPLGEPLTVGLDDDMRHLDSPFADIQRGTFFNCSELMSDMGAKILLTGVGGDELTHEEYYLRDLAVRGQYIRLLYEAWTSSKSSWNSFGWLFADSLRAAAPGFVKKFYRNIQKDNNWAPPEWAQRDFVEFYRSCPEPPLLPKMGFKSQTQESAFQFLNFPRVCLALEALECHSSYKGFEVRHPFFDKPLAEYVLSIPFEMRIPRGHWKYLLREGLANELPPEVLNRGRKTMFTSYNNSVFKKEQFKLKALLFDKQDWASSFYISREEAFKLFENFEMSKDLSSIKSLIESGLLWRIATLELWLRKISCYN